MHSRKLEVSTFAAVVALTLSGCGGGGGPAVVRTPTDGSMPLVHAVDVTGLHGLADWLTVNPGGSVTVPAGEYRDVGGVRFSCPEQGRISPDCDVTVTSTGGTVMISSTGGKATGEVINPMYWIVQSADTLLMSDSVARRTPFGDFRVQTDCTGGTCTMRAAVAETNVISLSDLRVNLVRQGLSPDVPTNVTETHRGVSLNTLEDYDGWLNYSVFLAGRGSPPWTYPQAYSFGDAAGSNPVSGSATWSGVMVGVDVSKTAYRNRIRGDADLTIADFSDPALDVAFTNIRDVDAGRTLADMAWDNVPMTNGGFRTGSDGDSIQGKFYGPNHDEAGGIF